MTRRNDTDGLKVLQEGMFEEIKFCNSILQKQSLSLTWDG